MQWGGGGGGFRISKKREVSYDVRIKKGTKNTKKKNKQQSEGVLQSFGVLILGDKNLVELELDKKKKKKRKKKRWEIGTSKEDVFGMQAPSGGTNGEGGTQIKTKKTPQKKTNKQTNKKKRKTKKKN